MIEQVSYELDAVHMAEAIDQRLLADHGIKGGKMRGEAFYDHMVHRLVFQFTKHLATQKEVINEHRTPEDWWEAFKERWFPLYMLSRWPVKYRTIRSYMKYAFPTVDLSRVPSAKHVTFPQIRDVKPLYYDAEVPIQH